MILLHSRVDLKWAVEKYSDKQDTCLVNHINIILTGQDKARNFLFYLYFRAMFPLLVTIVWDLDKVL